MVVERGGGKQGPTTIRPSVDVWQALGMLGVLPSQASSVVRDHSDGFLDHLQAV